MTPGTLTLGTVAALIALAAGVAVLRAAPAGAPSAGDVFDGPRIVKIVDGDTFDIEVRGQVERVRPTMLDAVERGHDDYARAADALAELLHGARDLRVEVVKLDRWTWGTPRRPRLIARVTAQFPNVAHLNANARVPLGVALVGLAMIDADERGRTPWAIPYVPALRKLWKGIKR